MRRLRFLWHELVRPRGRVRNAIFEGPRRSRASRGGIALLMVIASITFVTVIVAEVNYAARVRLLMAANERNEVAAQYLAQSGVSIYRLVLVADKQLSGSLGDMVPFPVQGLWQMVPAINTGLLRMFFGSGGSMDSQDLEQFEEEGISDEIREESREASRFDDKNFLDFEGDFAAEVTDADSKINIRRLGRGCIGDGQLSCTTLADLQADPVALQLFGLMCGTEEDQWFYERNIDRWELIGNLYDWMDLDTNRIFRGGYEDSLYNGGDSPYLSKNAPFDTKEEIRLVAGWEDEVYEKYADQITIYGGGKVNVNTASDEVILGLARAWVVPTPNDQQIQTFLQRKQEHTLLFDFGSPKEFADFLAENFNGEVKPGLVDQIGTESSTFIVTSEGLVGDTNAKATAVFDFSDSKVGRVKYWRVE